MARRTLSLIVIAAALGAAAAFWVWRASSSNQAPVPSLGVANPARPGGPVPAPEPDRANPAPSVAIATAPPPGLTPEQWATVEAGLVGHPQAAAERERLHGYFSWSHTVQRWRVARHDATLARAIDAGLPERLAREEVSVPEALLLKAALLQTLEPDEAKRTAALQAFRDALPQAAGPGPVEREFQQRQAAVVAAWQAQPAAQRDPAALQRQLEALRRQIFQTKETSR